MVSAASSQRDRSGIIIKSHIWQTDIFINLNNRNWTVLFGQEAELVEVGLLYGLLSIGVAFDNFEFEEIEP